MTENVDENPTEGLQKSLFCKVSKEGKPSRINNYIWLRFNKTQAKLQGPETLDESSDKLHIPVSINKNVNDFVINAAVSRNDWDN